MAGPFSNLEDRFKEIEDDGRRMVEIHQRLHQPNKLLS